MRQRMMLIAVAILLIVAASTYIANPHWKEKRVLKVFHAGSLTAPFEDIKVRFEEDQKTVLRDVEVQLIPAGSVACIQQITELGMETDVLASADYSLIPKMMIPDYADWYILFARNRMTLAYTNGSRYADEITADNWFEILRRDDMKWGFANPNADPCGYRALMVIQLAELEYGDDAIFDDLVEANSAIKVSEEMGCYTVNADVEDLAPDTERLTIRDKSVELVSLVQLGGLDYAFEYSSVARQHGLRYLELPESIDLSDVAFTETYRRVQVLTTTGVSAGKPIVYGATIPKNAQNRALAEKWLEYMISEFGRGVFTENGQPPITPAVASNLNNIPEGLRPYVTVRGG